MRLIFSLIAVFLILAAACSGYDIPNSRPLGVFSAQDIPDGTGGYYVKPTAAFYEAKNNSLPYSATPPDTCIDAAWPIDTTGGSLPVSLDPGSPVHFQTDLGTGTMTPDTVAGRPIRFTYKGGGVPHTPGANIIFTVDGTSGGFPGGTQTMISAKKLVLGPVDPAPADLLHLTWVTGQPGVAAVNINLIYRAPRASHLSAIECSLWDDGDYVLNVKQSQTWAAADTTNSQEVEGLRWITTYNTGSNNSLWLSISLFDTLKTTLP